MFTDPQYESYVTLCRALRLEHKFKVGDWALRVLTLDGFRIQWWLMTASNIVGWPVSEEHFIWIPRLDQLRDMLDEAGMKVIEIERREAWPADPANYPAGFYASCNDRAYDCEWSCSTDYDAGPCPSAEKALLDLWLAATGRNADGGIVQAHRS